MKSIIIVLMVFASVFAVADATPASTASPSTALQLNVGLKRTSTTTSPSNSFDAKYDFLLGILYNTDLGNAWAFRTGISYSSRSWSVVAGNALVDYWDIPLTGKYTFNESWSAFMGFVLGYKVGFSGSDNVTDTGYKSTILPIALGGTYSFGGNKGVSLEYEMSTKAAESLGSTLNFSSILVTYQYGY